jgi:subfamily B ATP-binding cassette protein MsbA
MESSELQEMKQRSQALESRLLSAARTKARTSPIVEIFGILALVVVLIIALRDVAGDHIGGAALLSFFTSLALLSQSASKLSKYLNSNREGSAAASRLSQALNVLQENERQALMIGNIESGPTNKITCQQVSAQYPDTNSYALKNFSYVFEGGKLYCITGTSGAGKSTLFNVLLGIMRPSGGSVSYSVSSSHELPILFMPQDYQVIAGPLVQNVSYPNEQFDVEKIYQAFEKVELPLKEISSLDVGPSGNLQLSGGQAQRVALARLAYHKAPFVLVDEGTSALDPEIEREILTFLQGLAREGACVIMIAHRSAAAAASNVVLQLEHGELKTSISQ